MTVEDKSILLIASEFPPNVGGIGNHAYNLAKALQNEGYKVTVVADIIEVDDEELTAFASTQSFKINWIKRQSPVFKTYLQRIRTSVRLAGKSKTVICSGKFSLWTGIIIKSFYPKKELVAVVHGTELDLKSTGPKKLTDFALRKFDKIISVSNYTSRFLPANLSSKTKKYIIHNGINYAEFVFSTTTKLTGEPALITVGNLTPRKGQENVIKAIPEIQNRYPQVQYHLVGKPTNRKQLESVGNECKVDGALKFYGAVGRKELLDILQGASIKLMLSNHTSNGDFEGFGIAVLEANAFGIPAIGSRDSGIADAIEHNNTGLLVDQHNKNEVTGAIETIMNNYAFFSNNAKHWAMQHDWKNIVKEYVEAIND